MKLTIAAAALCAACAASNLSGTYAFAPSSSSSTLSSLASPPAAFLVSTSKYSNNPSRQRRRRTGSEAPWVPLRMSTTAEPTKTSSSGGEVAGAAAPTGDIFGKLVNGAAGIDAGLAAGKVSVASYLSKFKGDTGAHIIYSKLLEHGTTVVNGYSGGAVLPLLDQFHPDHPRHEGHGAPGGPPTPIRWITNSNESSAGHVAEGIAKSSTEADGKLAAGVVVCTSGPGVTNLVTPVQDAMCDGVPLVVFCGQAATFAPVDAFQSAPAVDIMKPCTKWSYQIKNAAELPFVLDYAFFVARNGRPGPVFIDLPKDLQIQPVTDELIAEFAEGLGVFDPSVSQGVAPASSDDVLVKIVPETGAIRVGTDGKGLSFRVKEGHLDLIADEHSDAFFLDHKVTDAVYAGTKYENVSADSPNKGSLSGSDLMTEMMGLILNAEKPVIIAGQGCNDASAELKQFAEALQIPVTTTLHGLGCFDERHPLALNMLGMHGHATPNYMLQESDLVICIGSRFDDRITGKPSDFLPEARKAAAEERGGVIHVDVRFSENAKQIQPNFFVHSTGKTFLTSALKAMEGMPPDQVQPKTSEWIERKHEMQESFPIGIPKFPSETVTGKDEDGNDVTLTRTRMSAQHVVNVMNHQLVKTGKIDDAIVSTGVGIHQMVTAQLVTWTQPRQMISSGSLGTMGVSTGYCVGTKLANDGKICISVDGDGSFNMTFTELKTIAEQKIPVKLMILDNESQMMVEYWQRLFHDSRFLAVTNTENPEYTKLAESFGIKSIYCDCKEDLEAKMKEFLFDDPDEPVLFHVRIERTPCLPMVAPGQPLDNMILVDEDFEVDKAAAPS